ncbi:MAG: MBL fold metallo-hydrolase [Candidatus Pacebacteria bacterium]|nr:MBL fold metallo-hydrolase [Candidatus Paceibacterota bacterium]
MNITKFGQSCLLIEETGPEGVVRIILDPGSFSTAQNDLKDIDLVLITHEHGDHVDVNSLKQIVAHNPQAEIITTAGTKATLDKEGISSEVLKHGENVTKKGITIEGIGEKHAILINSMPQIENVGFLINGRLFYPGDALTEPGREIEILALPAAAPWAKLSEIVDYTLAVKPKVAFPVHDSILAHPAMMQGMYAQVFQGAGIDFRPVELNKEYEF